MSAADFESGMAEAFSGLPPGIVSGWLFAFGLVLGSFLNVVIHRVPRGLSVVHPRSACPSCRRMIPWYENIPVLSWLLLRARCAGCGLPISWRYPAVELLFALEVLLAYRVFGPGIALPVAILLLFLLTSLVFTDLEHFLLPDALTLPGTVLGLLLSFVSPLTSPEDALLGVLAAILVIEGINLAYKLLRGRDGMGAGDTKMLMLIGAFLGWRMALFSMMSACIVGAVFGLSRLLVLAVSRRTDIDPIPLDDSESASEEEPPQEPARRSALLDLIPDRPEGLLAPLIYLALITSFYFLGGGSGAASPWATPSRALGGLLIGLVVMRIHDRLAGTQRPPGSPTAGEIWPLLGSIAGVPPSWSSALAALVTGLACLILRAPVARGLQGISPPAVEPDQASATLPADVVPAGAIPLGVFLGLGAAVALFGGDAIVQWYLDSAMGLIP